MEKAETSAELKVEPPGTVPQYAKASTMQANVSDLSQSLPPKFGPDPIDVTCPNCHNPVKTQTEDIAGGTVRSTLLNILY
jgi:hypothetical protein